MIPLFGRKINFLLGLTAWFMVACGAAQPDPPSASGVSTPTLIFVEDSGGDTFDVELALPICNASITVTILEQETLMVLVNSDEFLAKCGLICSISDATLTSMIEELNPTLSNMQIANFLKAKARVCKEKNPTNLDNSDATTHSTESSNSDDPEKPAPIGIK